MQSHIKDNVHTYTYNDRKMIGKAIHKCNDTLRIMSIHTQETGFSLGLESLCTNSKSLGDETGSLMG